LTDNLLSPRSAVPHDVWAARLSSVWDVGIVVLGSDQDVDFANARARTLLAASTDSELEQRWHQLRQTLGRSLRTPTSSSGAAVEVTVTLTENGPGKDLRVQIYDIAEEGCVGHLLVIQHAERASAIESALRHATHDRGMSSLFRDVAHDLKGLLNVIAMNVEILSRVSHSPGPLSADQAALAERSAQVVRRELARLDRSLGVLLDRNATERPTPQRFDVAMICRGLVELVGARARRQEVTLALQLPDHPAEVLGFSERIHGALLNLIVNALDAMPGGGTLSVEVQRSSTIRILVSDTGPGVDSDLADQIWQLHFTNKPGGTGIGLYVARAVAEAHGGRVSQQRNSSGGACFIMELPAAPNA
jgi:signal transduction histidine kinase